MSYMFGIIRRDPETVLVPPTTTRIPGRITRTWTEGLRLLGLLLTVRTQSVRSHAVTSSLFSKSVFNLESSKYVSSLNSDPLLHCIQI